MNDTPQSRSPRNKLPLTFLAVMIAMLSLTEESRAEVQDERRSSSAHPDSPEWTAALRDACWSLVERDIVKGVKQGIRDLGWALSLHDREDAEATALMKAWSKLGLDQLRSPRAWARVVGRNTARDMLRRHNTDILTRAERDDEEAPLETLIVDTRTPEDSHRDSIVQGVHNAIATWPEDEAALAQAILTGEADTITGAAHWLRAQDEASTMYPSKAKLLLESHKKELAPFFDALG